MSKLLFVYHSGDSDGIMPALMAKTFLDTTNIVFKGYNYEESPEFLNVSNLLSNNISSIFFIDCTPRNLAQLQHILEVDILVAIMDHHEQPVKSIEDTFADWINEQLFIVADYSSSATYMFYEFLEKQFVVAENNRLRNRSIMFDTWSDLNVVFNDNLSIKYDSVEMHNQLHALQSTFINNIDCFDTWSWYDNYTKTKSIAEAMPFIVYWGLHKTLITMHTEAYGLDDDFSDDNGIVRYVIDNIDNAICTQIVDSMSDEDLITKFFNKVVDTGMHLYMENLRFNRNDDEPATVYSATGETFCVIYVNTKVNPFHTASIEHDVINEELDCDFIVYYNKLDDESYKLSLRSINKDLNMHVIANTVFDGGGGHVAAAGAKTVKLFGKHTPTL